MIKRKVQIVIYVLAVLFCCIFSLSLINKNKRSGIGLSKLYSSFSTYASSKLNCTLTVSGSSVNIANQIDGIKMILHSNRELNKEQAREIILFASHEILKKINSSNDENKHPLYNSPFLIDNITIFLINKDSKLNKPLSHVSLSNSLLQYYNYDGHTKETKQFLESSTPTYQENYLTAKSILCIQNN